MEKFAVFCLLSRVSKKRERKSNDQQFLDKNLPHPERWRRVGAVAFYPFICVLLVPRRGGSFVLFPGRRSQAQWMLVKRFARGKNCLLIVKLIQSWTTHTHTETHTNSHTDAPKGWLRLSEWITVCVCDLCAMARRMKGVRTRFVPGRALIFALGLLLGKREQKLRFERRYWKFVCHLCLKDKREEFVSIWRFVQTIFIWYHILRVCNWNPSRYEDLWNKSHWSDKMLCESHKLEKVVK